MSEQPPDLQPVVDWLAALSDEELAAVIARSAEAFAAGENGPDVPAAYPLHAPERSAPTQR
jgi:hypothetical protein